MTLQEMKIALRSTNVLRFQLPNGQFVPEHFHVTEVGKITRHFIDCGGTERKEQKVNFQLWNADDTDHRLKPQKLANIISLAENKLGIENDEIEVEYQGETISKYAIDFTGDHFVLLSTSTDCLAKDKCGITPGEEKKEPVNLAAASQCVPGGGCC